MILEALAILLVSATLVAVDAAGQSVDGGRKDSAKIICIGDSITQGVEGGRKAPGLPNTVGYRGYLQDLLAVDATFPQGFDFVGQTVHFPCNKKTFDPSQPVGSAVRYDGECSAWGGKETGDLRKILTDGYAKAPFTADYCLILLGVNDGFHNKKVDAAAENLSATVDLLYRLKPSTHVLLATIPLNRATKAGPWYGPRFFDGDKGLNARIRAEVATRLEKKQNISLVDIDAAMRGVGYGKDNPNYDPTDDAHPNDAGYRTMAKAWFEGLKKAAAKKS